MEITTLLEYSDRSQLRAWLRENHSKEKECWIDSTLKRLPDGRLAQRLSPRRKKSHWTKLNMDRCMDLEDLLHLIIKYLFQARFLLLNLMESLIDFQHFTR